MAPLRWGIVSAGNISSDFVNAVQMLDSQKHVVVAVAARSVNSAKKFAEKFGIKKAYGDYDALSKDPEIDVVYIGAVNITHLAIGKAMLAAGKPVLCEKPLCMNLRDTETLLSAAKKENQFFMEAMWSRCNPVYRELRSRLDKGEIGEVTHVTVTFGVIIAEVNRVYRKEIGGGCLLDYGIYVINLILVAMNDEMPLEIQAMGTRNDEGLETEVTCTMKFSNNRYGTFVLSSISELPNEGYVTGTKGTFKLESPFWSTTSLSGPSGTFNCPLDATTRVFNYPNSQMLKFEAEEVAQCLKEGRKESALVPHELSLKYAKLLQEVAAKAGVNY